MVWQSYKHRLVPWVAFNWSTRQIKQSEVKSDASREISAFNQLAHLCQVLDDVFPPCTVKEWKKMESIMDLHASKARAVMQKELGFSLLLGKSEVDKLGRGVFVTDAVSKERLVGLYPGAVYLPFEPLFFQSLWNPFIFRCVDGYLIDGNHRGVSKFIFKSCAYRDTVSERLSCDPSWLSITPMNPLAIGQFVNNHTRAARANVEYVELTIPDDFPLTWRRFLPNVFYSPSTEDTRLMRCMGLVTTCDIEAGEELLSSYLTVVNQ